MPPRVEPHESWIADVRERALRTVRWKKPKHGVRTHAESRERGIDGKARRGRRDVILEHDVEHRLLPCEIDGIRQWWSGHVRERAIKALERAIRRERDVGRDDFAVVEPSVVFVELDVVGDPELRGVR